MTVRRLLVIHNPVAGARRRRRYEATLAALADAGCAVTVHETRGRGDAEEISRAQHGSFDAVVAAGGDGTINEVANGLAGAATPLGVIPLGTANVLAAEAGLPLAPARVAEVLSRGRSRAVFAGIANGRHFLMMAGVGFDARTVARLRPQMKRRFGKGAYAAAAFEEWWDNSLPRYTVAIDGVAAEVASIVVSKGRCYGGAFVLAPRADLGVAQFETVSLPHASRGALLALGSALALRAPAPSSAVRMALAQRIQISGPIGEPVQADGDIVAHLPVDITVAPDPLQLLAP